jgi:hypothetical protein
MFSVVAFQKIFKALSALKTFKKFKIINSSHLKLKNIIALQKA